MRQTRVLTEYDPKRGTSVATLAYEYPNAYQVPEHAHASDQLIYAIRGLMLVSSGNKTWLIPPHFALWIPARQHHRLHMRTAVSMRTLYLRPGLVRHFGKTCQVLHVTNLLREVILEIVAAETLRIRNAYECALRDVLLRCLQNASPLPTLITLPRDPRALKLAESVLAQPGASRPLAVLCGQIGLSVRTLQRLFQKELGMDFDSWRRQVRLMKAVELLIAGSSVKQTAFDVGYRQPSAFVEMFRTTFGETPKAWITGLQGKSAQFVGSYGSVSTRTSANLRKS
jgi:AraC-like DNA-binding protein/mannose-6-phosphate isomerase-like protein (cupin superfamily)